MNEWIPCAHISLCSKLSVCRVRQVQVGLRVELVLNFLTKWDEINAKRRVCMAMLQRKCEQCEIFTCPRTEHSSFSYACKRIKIIRDEHQEGGLCFQSWFSCLHMSNYGGTNWAEHMYFPFKDGSSLEKDEKKNLFRCGDCVTPFRVSWGVNGNENLCNFSKDRDVEAIIAKQLHALLSYHPEQKL